ncbi:MAG: hypothetical protein WCQ96_02940 [Patescibacteria group bacterium]
MPKLYYKNEFRGDLTEAQATRIKESMSQKPQPQNLTINGEFLKTSQIEVFKDEIETEKIPDNVKFKEKGIKTEREIEAMRRWSVERKVEFNFTRNFSVRFLLRVGYTNYLGEDWKKWSEEKQDYDYNYWWKKFSERYKSENENQYLELCEIMAEYFENNPNEYWCSAELYKHLLPQYTAKSFNNLGLRGGGEYDIPATRDKTKKAELKF